MRRRTEGLLKGMWVYYLLEGEAAVTVTSCQIDTKLRIASLLKKAGYTVVQIGQLLHMRHTFTHRIWDMAFYAVHIKENYAIEDYRLLSPDEAETIPLPAAMRYSPGKM
jgi:adenine-specific DNA glycosylase